MSAALTHGAKAQTVPDFLRDHGIGRTKFYAEIAAGRLKAVKSGGRTLVLAEDAERWRASLPALTTPRN